MAFPVNPVIKNFSYGVTGSPIFLQDADSDFSQLGDAFPVGATNTDNLTNATNPYGGAYLNSIQPGPDVEAYIENTVSLCAYYGVFARMQSPGGSKSGYKVGWNNNLGGEITIERIDSGTSFTLQTVSFTRTLGYLGIEIIGNTIKGYTNTGGGWVERISTTDNTYSAAGYTGFDLYQPGGTETSRLDNYGAGTITSEPLLVPTLNIVGGSNWRGR